MGKDDPPPYTPGFVQSQQAPAPEGGYPPSGYPAPQSGYPHPAGYPQPQSQPYPHPGYPQPTSTDPFHSIAGNTTVVVTGTAAVPLGPNPVTVTCPSCHHQIVTRVETSPDTKTHLFALLICLFCFPCACLPYCMDSCQSQKHYCPQCGSYIGVYQG